MPNFSSASFGDYVAVSLGLALWLLPILAWYDVFRSWAKGLMGDKDTMQNKLIFAIVLTIIVFLIMALFRGLSPKTTAVQVTQPVAVTQQ